MRAFMKGYDYYRVKKDCLGLKAGAIFYHDTTDKVNGSIAAGCLKLAWDADGNCSFGPCGDTYVLHASAREDTEFLELIDISKEDHFMKHLKDKMQAKLESAKLSFKASKGLGYCEGQQAAYRDILRLIDSMIENHITIEEEND